MGKQNKPKRDARHLHEQEALPLLLFVLLNICELALARRVLRPASTCG